MRLESFRLSLLAIPFKLAFNHASAQRSAGCSLWVEARDRDGNIGYGEGCPRDYVTGETFDSGRRFMARHKRDWCESIRDLAALRRWIEDHRREIDANPAAWAACELALLDLLGKAAGMSVEALLGLPEIDGRFRYTAVLGDAAPTAFEAQLARYRRAGFEDFKIKLCGDLARDVAKVRALTTARVAPCAVRADANNLWSDPATALAYLEALRFPFRALEEPLRAGDYAGLRCLSAWFPGRIILDESLVKAEQLESLACDPQRWVVNLRVSKMGGLLRSLEVLRAGKRLGIPVVIGAHVGETSLLTRAALPLAQQAGGSLFGQEGAYGTHLLERDVVDAPLMFSHGGLLDALGLGIGRLPGLGLDVEPYE